MQAVRSFTRGFAAFLLCAIISTTGCAAEPAGDDPPSSEGAQAYSAAAPSSAQSSTFVAAEQAASSSTKLETTRELDALSVAAYKVPQGLLLKVGKGSILFSKTTTGQPLSVLVSHLDRDARSKLAAAAKLVTKNGVASSDPGCPQKMNTFWVMWMLESAFQLFAKNSMATLLLAACPETEGAGCVAAVLLFVIIELKVEWDALKCMFAS